jgi:hypothetical protein
MESHVFERHDFTLRFSFYLVVKRFSIARVSPFMMRASGTERHCFATLTSHSDHDFFFSLRFTTVCYPTTVFGAILLQRSTAALGSVYTPSVLRPCVRFSVRDVATARLLPLLFSRDHVRDRAREAVGRRRHRGRRSGCKKPLYA